MKLIDELIISFLLFGSEIKALDPRFILHFVLPQDYKSIWLYGTSPRKSHKGRSAEPIAAPKGVGAASLTNFPRFASDAGQGRESSSKHKILLKHYYSSMLYGAVKETLASRSA